MLNKENFGLDEYLHSLKGDGYELKRGVSANGLDIITATAPPIRNSPAVTELNVYNELFGLADLSLAIGNGEGLLGVRHVWPGIKSSKLAGQEYSPKALKVSSFGDDVTTYLLEKGHLIGVYLGKGYDSDGVTAAGRSCAEMIEKATKSSSLTDHKPHDIGVVYSSPDNADSISRLEELSWLSYDVPDSLKSKVVIFADRGKMTVVTYSEGRIRAAKNGQNAMQGDAAIPFSLNDRHFSAVEKDGTLEVIIREDGSSSFEQIAAQVKVPPEANAAMYAAAMSEDRWLDVPRSGIVQAFSVHERP